MKAGAFRTYPTSTNGEHARFLDEEEEDVGSTRRARSRPTPAHHQTSDIAPMLLTGS